VAANRPAVSGCRHLEVVRRSQGGVQPQHSRPTAPSTTGRSSVVDRYWSGLDYDRRM